MFGPLISLRMIAYTYQAFSMTRTAFIKSDENTHAGSKHVMR